MTKFCKIVSCLCFCLPMSLAAEPEDRVKEKRIVIHTEGGVENSSLAEILDQVTLGIGDETDVNVFVTVDEDGSVHIEKVNEPGLKHGIHKIVRLRDRSLGSFHEGCVLKEAHRAVAFRLRDHKPMSEAAANCVLKNLGKVDSDVQAHLLDRACQTLNPAAD